MSNDLSHRSARERRSRANDALLHAREGASRINCARRSSAFTTGGGPVKTRAAIDESGKIPALRTDARPEPPLDYHRFPMRPFPMRTFAVSCLCVNVVAGNRGCPRASFICTLRLDRVPPRRGAELWPAIEIIVNKARYFVINTDIGRERCLFSFIPGFVKRSERKFCKRLLGVQ